MNWQPVVGVVIIIGSVVIIIGVGLIFLVAYSLCWSAGKADEANDKLLAELLLQKQTKGEL